MWKKILHKTNFDWCHLFLITKCYFTIANLVFKQEIDNTMGIDPPSYWANFFVYIFESKYVHQLIARGFAHAYKFRGTSRFIDDLSTIIDGGEFSSSCKYIYTKQVQLTGVLKICSKFTGEHTCRSVMSIKLLCCANLLKSYFGMGVLL